ncbi:PREDICTED: homeotic protein caudal-like [Dinoponera quadriceps]|uniref:Homeotic protein caudal-like n=1 Tax=Dinoponera quadriceps TaxID=609295 RepID=A0A6P3XEL7_DINQU|nr:PREDICTED: homeotic protein caudal-like [Dinoponera quadriceps]
MTALLETKEGEGGGGGGGGRSVTGAGGGGGGGGGRRAPSLRLVNGRATTGVSLHTSSTESVRSPHHHLGQQQTVGNNNCTQQHAGNNPAANNHPRLNKDDSIKISIENTNTCTDSLVTALDDETLLITDFLGDTAKNKHYGLSEDAFYGG